MVGEDSFIEVFVDTPITVCEQRDTKGMYALARSGQITNFTGVDDPYEEPVSPELRIDTVIKTAEQNADDIIALITQMGFIKVGGMAEDLEHQDGTKIV
jgi:sulfate adenylyltransferase